MDPKDLIQILMSVVGGLMSLVGFLVWRILQRIEEKVESLHYLADTCRASLPGRFAAKQELEQCQLEVDNLWDAVNHHEHDEFGRVIRL